MASNVEITLRAIDLASGVIGSVGNALGNMAKVAGAAVRGATDALGGFLASSVKDAMEAENALTQLNAVLQSTGGAAGVTAKEIQDLSDALANQTRFTDEAIMGGASMLLTFTNIGKDIFPQATETTLDMSQALGQDLKSSAIQLGKALNEPVEGVTALRRVGVQFTDEQEELIKSLAQTGRLEEAQAMILKELQKEFGGSAKAAGQTLAGQLDILKNKLSNVKEGIGMALIPALSALGDLLSSALNNPQVLAFIEGFSNGIATLAGKLATLFETWKTQGFSLSSIMEMLGVGNIDPSALGNLILAKLSEAWVYVTSQFRTMMETIDWGELSNSLADKINSIEWEKVGQYLITGIQNLIAGLVAFLSGVDWMALFDSITMAVAEFIAGLFGTTFDDVRAKADLFWADLGAKFQNGLAAIGAAIEAWKAFWIGMWELLKTAAVTAFNAVVSGVTAAISPIIGAFSKISDAISDVIGWIGNLASAFLDLVIPDWLTPGSPTPFELGLLGINDALKKVSNTAPSMGLFNAPATVGASAGGGSMVTVNLSYAPVMSLGDENELQTRLVPLIINGVKEARAQGVIQ